MIEHKSIDIHGERLAYYDEGDGEAILLVHGLSRHGDRTQLYTSRGTGFWGPPFRVFAPSEITLLTLRSR